MTWLINHLVMVTVLMILLTLAIVGLLLWVAARFYHHEKTSAHVMSALTGVVITVLLSVHLNGLYALKRDRDARLRTLRDQHLAHLKPVLRTEASELQRIGDEIRRSAHVTLIGDKAARHAATVSRLWPESTLSPDLQNHFPEYDRDKRALLDEIDTQDQEFFALLLRIQTMLRPPEIPQQFGSSIYIIQKCAGAPVEIPEQVLMSYAYKSFKADVAMNSHCESLKQRAKVIADHVADLSKTALRLSEFTTLDGACQFMKPDTDNQ